MSDTRKCERCGTENPRRYSEVCGLCEISTAIKNGERVHFGARTNKLVPPHFNKALGEWVDGYDDLKKKTRANPNTNEM